MTEQIEYRHSIPIQIRFNDVDPQGHVNNSVYFSFYDLGKTSYFRKVAEWDLDKIKVGIVAAHISADFLAPLKGHEPVAVQTAVTEIGHKSFKLVQQLINTENQEIKCICTSVMVAFDTLEQHAVEMPEDWKSAICAFEGKDLNRKKEGL